jgi:DNA invertase Pin-like site-specific DNA recombinase
MTNALEHNHITASQLNRKAIVYVRQSSERQVLRNKESQRLQYALKDRALALGFNRVEIIDEDMGLSASGVKRRPGFERMLSSVVNGEVGIILSREVSRLSRSNRDWCHLFEACGLCFTLIGDDEQVYDPNNMDDQLVLGIKATLSVVELKILQMRLVAGTENKARRGELQRLPPPGYVWDASDKLVKDPDDRVREAIALIFTKFYEIRSIRQTFLWFHNNNTELPVNRYIDGRHILEWKLPTKSFITSVLQNPCYAGAYVWGRRTTRKEYRDGRIIKRLTCINSPEKSRVLIKDHHENYIDWRKFEEVQALISQNAMNLGNDESAGAAREGQGLLCGLLRCGHCGRKMHVRYWGRQGTAARYLCKGDFESGGSYCLGFDGSLVDRRFSKEILKVISPYGIEAGIRAAQMICGRDDEQIRLLEQKLKQVEYEERRAFEQYNEVDPRHRLVAEELEKRWNGKLEEISQVKNQMTGLVSAKHSLDRDEERTLMNLGEQFSLVWESDRCSPSIKKNILRIVIEEAVVTLSEETSELTFIIHWKGGCHTSFIMPRPPGAKGHKTSVDDLEIIGKMAVRYGDDEIARVLNKLGRRTGKGNRWNALRVKTARLRSCSIKTGELLEANEEIFSLGQAARYCGISHKSVQKLAVSGVLEKSQIVPFAPWEIRKSDLDSPTIQRIIKNLRATGKLTIEDVVHQAQLSLFGETGPSC